MKLHSNAFNEAPDDMMALPANGAYRPDCHRSAPDLDPDSEAAKRIEQSIAYMRQHLNRPLQIAKLAQVAHISASHYFVLFKRCVGYSPMEYFIRLRMQRAGQMLANTSLSVKEVAADLGYDDPFYFSRVFKSVHGTAPSNYREMIDEVKQSARPQGSSASDGLPLPRVQSAPLGEAETENDYSSEENHAVLQSA